MLATWIISKLRNVRVVFHVGNLYAHLYSYTEQRGILWKRWYTTTQRNLMYPSKWRLKVVQKLETYPSLHMLDYGMWRNNAFLCLYMNFPFFSAKRKPWLYEPSSHLCHTPLISFYPEVSALQHSYDRSLIVGHCHPKSVAIQVRAQHVQLSVLCFFSCSGQLWLFPFPHRAEKSLHRLEKATALWSRR